MIFHFNWVIPMFHVNFQWVQGFIWALWKHIPSECVLGGTHLGGQCGRWILCTYIYIYMSYASFGMLE